MTSSASGAGAEHPEHEARDVRAVALVHLAECGAVPLGGTREERLGLGVVAQGAPRDREDAARSGLGYRDALNQSKSLRPLLS